MPTGGPVDGDGRRGREKGQVLDSLTIATQVAFSTNHGSVRGNGWMSWWEGWCTGVGGSSKNRDFGRDDESVGGWGSGCTREGWAWPPVRKCILQSS